MGRLGLALTALNVVAITAAIWLGVEYRKASAEYDAFTDAIVRRDSGLPLRATLDPLKASVAIRDWVYRSFTPKPRDALPGADPPIRYASLGTPQATMECGGATETFIWALRAVGLHARLVQLAGKSYLDGTDRFDTHVTAEVLIGDKWVVSDPTYNVSFRCGGELLSVIGIEGCLAHGMTPVPVHGKGVVNGRQLPKGYFHYYAAFVIRKPQNIDAPKIEHPEGWLEQASAQYDSKGD